MSRAGFDPPSRECGQLPKGHFRCAERLVFAETALHAPEGKVTKAMYCMGGARVGDSLFTYRTI